MTINLIIIAVTFLTGSLIIPPSWVESPARIITFAYALIALGCLGFTYIGLWLVFTLMVMING